MRLSLLLVPVLLSSVLLAADRPTPLPAGPAGWFRTFRSGYCDMIGVPAQEREPLFEAAATRMPADMLGEDGIWRADYVRLRFSMRKVN